MVDKTGKSSMGKKEGEKKRRRKRGQLARNRGQDARNRKKRGWADGGGERRGPGGGCVCLCLCVSVYLSSFPRGWPAKDRKTEKKAAAGGDEAGERGGGGQRPAGLRDYGA